MEVESVVSFYAFLSTRPHGKTVIRLSNSVVEKMKGAGEIAKAFEDAVGVSFGETTPDGRFTLLPTCCIGYCDRAPAMMINRKVYGKLTPERIDEILEGLE